jgi:hypothetical protein
VRPGRGKADIVLHHCPFESTALAEPDSVCALHLGIAEGLAEGSGVFVQELIARDPRPAKCRVRLHKLLAPDKAGEPVESAGILRFVGRRRRTVSAGPESPPS